MITKDRLVRKKRIRAKVFGTGLRPRLSVFRSGRFIYAQIINDGKAVTLVSAKGSKSQEVGKALAEAAKKKKIKLVVFDRSGYRYHGRVKALADAAREGGLEF